MVFVIIPCYNVERYLERCVASVKSQSYSDYYAIMVNDGSKDGTGALCDRLAAVDPAHFCVIHKENGGLSDARNTGLERCFSLSANPQEDYVFMLDSDDFIHPLCLERLAALCEGNQADCAQCEVERGSGDTFTSQLVSTPEILVLSSKEALLNPRCKTMFGNKLYRLSTYENQRFPLRMMNEDEFLAYRMIWACRKVVLTSDTLFYYYQHEFSIMNTVKSHLRGNPHRNDFMKAFEERLAFFEAQQEPELVQRTHEKICTELLMRYTEQRLLPVDQRTEEMTNGDYLRWFREHYRYMIGLRTISPIRKLVFTTFYVFPDSAVLGAKITPLRK